MVDYLRPHARAGRVAGAGCGYACNVRGGLWVRKRSWACRMESIDLTSYVVERKRERGGAQSQWAKDTGAPPAPLSQGLHSFVVTSTVSQVR